MRLTNGCLSSINPFLCTPTRRGGQKSRCSTDWWLFIRCLSRLFPQAKVSLWRVVFVLLSDCMAEWEDGHWFLSACLSISAPSLYPSVEEYREGALLEIIPPTLPVRSDGERAIFNREQRLSGVSMPCSGRPDSSEMVPLYQLWHFYTEWTHSRCLCLEKSDMNAQLKYVDW